MKIFLFSSIPSDSAGSSKVFFISSFPKLSIALDSLSSATTRLDKAGKALISSHYKWVTIQTAHLGQSFFQCHTIEAHDCSEKIFHRFSLNIQWGANPAAELDPDNQLVIPQLPKSKNPLSHNPSSPT